jgi:translation elongation factor EF-4
MSIRRLIKSKRWDLPVDRESKKAFRRRGRLHHLRRQTISDTRIGTPSPLSAICPAPLPGFKDVKPVVFLPVSDLSEDYQSSRIVEKYKLNDAALVYQKDSSVALGLGFHRFSGIAA